MRFKSQFLLKINFICFNDRFETLPKIVNVLFSKQLI